MILARLSIAARTGGVTARRHIRRRGGYARLGFMPLSFAMKEANIRPPEIDSLRLDMLMGESISGLRIRHYYSGADDD